VKNEVLSCGYSFHTTRFIQSSHQLNDYLIRLQTSGRSMIAADGVKWLIEAGDLIMLPPGSRYELRIEERHNDPSYASIVSGDYYLFCSGTWTEQWWGRSPRPARTRIDLNDNLLYLWRQIISEKNGSVHENAELLNYLFRSFCLFLDKALAEPSPRDHNMFTASRMKRFIQRNVHRSFKVEDVANYVELSVSRASRIFKTCFGKTMTEYALDLRLQSAVDRMMYTTMTLEEIAESCGFGSYTFFHKAFKAKFGLSPAAFRNQSK